MIGEPSAHGARAVAAAGGRSRGGADRAADATPSSWLARRLFPLLAGGALIAIGMLASTVVEPHMFGTGAWALPDDLWGTLVAAQRLLQLDLGGLYTRPTGLISFPGAAVILAPIVAVSDAAGVSLAAQSAHDSQPAVWLLAGPYMIAISTLVLFGADALAERLGASRPRRAFLAAGGAIVLWSVSVEWGHPEDAVSVGLLLYAMLALHEERPARSAWLAGLAIAVQPLVLLALPVMLAAVERRRLAGFLARAAAPAAVLLGAAAAANWSATHHAVTSQPNWPAVNHPTPWTPFAPHLAGGAVAGGPLRAVAVLLACGCAVISAPRLRAARRPGGWSPEMLQELLWWAAVGLALRSVFEPVMVAYYLWPALTMALVAAARDWARLIPTSVLAVAVSLAAQSDWRSPWGWWGLMVAGLVLTLVFARRGARRARPGQGAHGRIRGRSPGPAPASLA